MDREARCAQHADVAAVGTCTRCGQFYCAEDRRLVDRVAYCSTCASRPDVDWLDSYRLKYWGKRDAWAWLVGAGALCNVLAFPAMVTNNQAAVTVSHPAAESSWVGTASIIAVQQLAAIAVCIAFWLGARWARVGLLGLPVLAGLTQVAISGNIVSVGVALLPLLFGFAIYQDTRNQLFFKIDVPRERLRKMWDRNANNSVARSGLQLSLASLFIPLFAPLGLGFSIVGLRRVDLGARPPVGRKGQAIAGVVIGALGMVWLGVWVFWFATRMA